MIRVEQLVADIKKNNPDYYGKMDDSDVYNMVKTKRPDLEWPEINPYEQKTDINLNSSNDILNAKDEDHSPSIFSDIALAGLPEMWADKHDWAAKAYNNSMAGLMYQIKEGKPKYEVEDYDSSVMEDVGGFFLGLASIPDLALFFGTAGLGSKVLAPKVMGSKTVQGLFKKGMAEGAERSVRNSAFRNKLIAQGALDSGFGLGTYGAAGGAIAEAARQSTEEEEFDYGKIVGQAVKAGVSGSIIGAASGGVGKGIMSPKFARAKMAQKAGDVSTKNLATRILNNPGSQVLAEAGIFTTGQLTEQSLLHDQEVAMDDFWRGMGTNLGIIGGMRAVFKPLRRNENDVTRYRKARNDFLGRENKRLLENFENIEAEFKEAGIEVPAELRDNLVASNLKNKREREAFDWMAKNEEKYKLLFSKDFKKLSEKERIDIIQNSNLVNTLRMGMYREVLKSKELREYMLEAELGRVPTKAESKNYKVTIEKRVNEHTGIKQFMNEIALGDKKRAGKTLAQLEMDNRKIELAELPVKTIKDQSTILGDSINSIKKALKKDVGTEIKDKLQKELVTLEKQKIEVDAQLPAAKQARANIELDRITTIKSKSKKPDLNIYGQEIKPGQKLKIPTDKSSVILDKKKKGFVATDKSGENIGTFKNQNIAKQAINVFNLEKPNKIFNNLLKAGYVSTPETVKSIAKFANDKFNQAVKNLGLSSREKRDLRNIVAEQAGIQKKVFTKKLNPNEVVKNANDLAKFIETLNRSNIQTLQRKKNIVDYFKSISEIENYNRTNKISPKEQVKDLKKLGVENGDISKATNEQLQLHKENLFLKDVKPKEVKIEKAPIIIADTPTTFLGKTALQLEMFVAPVVDVIAKRVSPRIANKLKKHISIETKLYGENYKLYEADIAKGYVRSDGAKISGITNKEYVKNADSMHILHAKGQKYLQSKKELAEKGRVLSKKQVQELQQDIAFFENAVNVKKWMKTVNKEGTYGEGLNAVENGILKFANYDSAQGKMYGRYADPKIGVPVSYKNALYRAVKANMSETEFVKWKVENKGKWIEDGLYITNVITPEFKFSANLSGLALEKIIKKQTDFLAKEHAREKYKTKNPTSEQIESVREYAKAEAIENLYGSNDFRPSTMNTKFLIERQADLPMFVKGNNNNWIRTYERSSEGTIQRYAVGMGKYIAGVETFPEYVKIDGIKSPGVKVELGQIARTDAGLALRNYTQSSIEQYLGINQKPAFSMAVKAANNASNFLAKTQLSMPTSGVKNTFLGNIQNLWAFDLLGIAKGYSEVFKKEHTRALIGGGHTELGTNIYQGGKNKFYTRVTEGLFKFGGMEATEKLMRNLTVLTSKSDQLKNIELLRNNKEGSKLYKKAYNRLSKFYEASNADINLLKKYGFEPPKDRMGNYILEGFKGSTFEKMKTSRLIENAHQFLDTMSHVKTQGSSASIFMPKVASNQYVRPYTLFKRMAYAATVNTGKNVKQAVESGNYMRLAAGALGTYFGGQALLGMYSYLLGSPVPKENSGWFENIKVAMWRGEFLGILSDIFSPYEGNSQSMYPSIAQTGIVIGKNIYEGATDKKDWFGKGLAPDKGTAFDEILRKTITVYNGATKAIASRTNPYSTESGKFRSLYNDFEDEFDPKKVDSPEFPKTVLSPYFNALRNAFEKGNEKEFAEAYILALYAHAGETYQKGYDLDGVRITTIDEAIKRAKSTLKTRITRYNPAKSPSKGASAPTKRKFLAWKRWLERDSDKNYIERITALEKEYKLKVQKLKKSFPHYARTHNLKDLASDFSLL
ncbi:MAG: hypothetical protein CBD97_01735 [Pelagibacteraceae bacterium TMED237]|nr:MAG: hypothetical protein CBD97_01735 [Pelagibacteraceae bacterium TMED237]|tara:strand:+ start:4919 stop:10279 length:5361 start_codon:yes stop_codon:yes gene_type:complete